MNSGFTGAVRRYAARRSGANFLERIPWDPGPGRPRPNAAGTRLKPTLRNVEKRVLVRSFECFWRMQVREASRPAGRESLGGFGEGNGKSPTWVE